MARLHVCPLSQVDATLATSGAAWAVSLLARADRVPAFLGLLPDRRLHLALSDIVQPTESYVLAERHHMDKFLAFLDRWDRATPLLIHCYAGVSRSTAAAFIALCRFRPDVPEAAHAATLRAASPQATPNSHLVGLADRALGREGRMLAAIASIGRGADCFEGCCFALDIPDGPLDAGRPDPA